MTDKIAEFWKIAGEKRKASLDGLEDSGIRLTPEIVLEETVKAVLETSFIESEKNKKYEDFLSDRRKEWASSYLKAEGVERNG